MEGYSGQFCGVHTCNVLLRLQAQGGSYQGRKEPGGKPPSLPPVLFSWCLLECYLLATSAPLRNFISAVLNSFGFSN